MTDLPYQIVPYEASHLAEITAIYGHHVAQGRASFEEVPPSMAEMAGRMTSLLDDGYPILVAQAASGAVLGYAYAGPHKLRSAYRYTVEDSIYVAPHAQRQGVGASLLRALISACEDGPFRQMMAVIGDSQNAASIGLHAACGFTMIGTAEKIGFKFGQWLDVVYMQRSLAGKD